MTAKRVRWKCAKCDNGVLGPGRPRRNNVVRYCLPCSAKAGVLVERFCPAQENKRKRKAEGKRLSVARKKEQTLPTPRNTKFAWMRQGRYVFAGPEGAPFNVMEAAKRLCHNAGWSKAVEQGITSTKAERHRTYCAGMQTAERLWELTQEARGKYLDGGCGIRISKTSKSWSSGRGGRSYGVTMSVSKDQSTGYALSLLLHEIVHFVHLTHAHAAQINGKRRPHDLCFNIILLGMAKRLWGYPFNAYQAGYSVGRGYAPSRHLDKWLAEQITEQNPRVMSWFGGADDE